MSSQAGREKRRVELLRLRYMSLFVIPLSDKTNGPLSLTNTHTLPTETSTQTLSLTQTDKQTHTHPLHSVSLCSSHKFTHEECCATQVAKKGLFILLSFVRLCVYTMCTCHIWMRIDKCQYSWNTCLLGETLVALSSCVCHCYANSDAPCSTIMLISSKG